MPIFLDRETFFTIFDNHTAEAPDGWKRVAAYQFGIKYEDVTSEQRAKMKRAYFAYVYSAGPQRFGETLNG